MTYASIQEVWGGVSGSNQLSVPLTHTKHPIHQQQIDRTVQKYPEPKYKNENEKYQCKYGSETCEKVFNQNEQYNNDKKMIAQGTQPQNFPHNYPPGILLPQYPWYPAAMQNYLMYGPRLSQMWYNNPMMYNPEIANQIMMQQMYNPGVHVMPMMPYTMKNPGGFGNEMKEPKQNTKRIEHFSSNTSADVVKTSIIYFIFFLISLAVILCICMICIVSYNK